METCKKKIILKIIISLLLILTNFNLSFADSTFKEIENKQVSFLDFFLLKFENTLIRRSNILSGQMIATRVQYSNIGTKVEYNKDSKKIMINLYAVMDKNRYSKKKYKQKLSDCNQVRNLIFYRKQGYKFFTQKRDPMLSEDLMEDIFKESFFNNISLSDKEIDFLLDKMFVNVSVIHPINKTELNCSGKANDYELN
tara:strand:+ start:1301 stop:1891 length:591 start_codon:yes stop_codon:yes gene_type:complete